MELLEVKMLDGSIFKMRLKNASRVLALGDDDATEYTGHSAKKVDLDNDLSRVIEMAEKGKPEKLVAVRVYGLPAKARKMLPVLERFIEDIENIEGGTKCRKTKPKEVK